MTEGRPRGDRPAVFTVGHSTREASELVALLAGHDVELLVDVRRYPTSSRHPQFDREALEETLAGAGIAYRHVEALGGMRSAGPTSESPNAGWRSDGFRAYADHLLQGEGREAFSDLEAAARRRTAAVMCAEAVPWRCHRQILADWLVARDFRVVHLIGPDRTDEHRLREMARVLEDGRVVYPGEDAEQGELFDEGS